MVSGENAYPRRKTLVVWYRTRHFTLMNTVIQNILLLAFGATACSTVVGEHSNDSLSQQAQSGSGSPHETGLDGATPSPSSEAPRSGGGVVDSGSGVEPCPPNQDFSCEGKNPQAIVSRFHPSLLDDSGCMLRFCRTDADCIEGEQCVDTSSLDCLPRATCELTDDGCECGADPSATCASFCYSL